MIENKQSDNLLFLGFNQDGSCFTTSNSYEYNVFHCYPFQKIYKSLGNASRVEMLYCTSLLAIVGNGDIVDYPPRRIRLYNTKNNKHIADLNFQNTIYNILMNKIRLIAVLERRIHIFDVKSLKILHSIDTDPNPLGICALSSTEGDGCYMAFPSSATQGDVMLYDVRNLQVLSVISAHISPISYLCFNHNGTKLVTASAKGTVLRMFKLPTGENIHTFRRGTKQTQISGIAINSNDTLLACSSHLSTTIHIFKITSNTSSITTNDISTNSNNNTISTNKPSLFYSLVDIAITQVQRLQEYAMTGVEVDHDFSRAILKEKENFATIAISFAKSPNNNILLAVHSRKNKKDGIFSAFEIPENGGSEARLLTEHLLDERISEEAGTTLFYDFNVTQQTQENFISSSSSLSQQQEEEEVAVINNEDNDNMVENIRH